MDYREAIIAYATLCGALFTNNRPIGPPLWQAHGLGHKTFEFSEKYQAAEWWLCNQGIVVDADGNPSIVSP